MKRYLILVAALFLVFAIAPQINGLRSTVSVPVVTNVQKTKKVTTSDDITPEELLKLLTELGAEEPAGKPPSIKRPKLAAGEHFIPLIRFTDIEINKVSVSQLAGALDQANAAGAEAIVLELATPGGVVTNGFEMARVIELSKAPIHCVVDGEVASMGFYVLQSCKTRMMTKRSALMVHEPSISTAAFTGPQSKWRNIEGSLHVTSEVMLEHEAKRLKISKEALRRKIENGQDWWMLYDEARTVGAVDGVVGSVEQVQASYQHVFRHPNYL